MDVFELNSFDKFAITLIKTHLLVTTVLCTFFLCSVPIRKSFEIAFIRTRKDASKRTTSESEPMGSQSEADFTTTATKSAKSFRPAEPKDGFQVWL